MQKKDTKRKKTKPIKTRNGKIILLLTRVVRDSKKTKIIEKKEPSALLSSLGIKTPLSKILLLGNILF